MSTTDSPIDWQRRNAGVDGTGDTIAGGELLPGGGRRQHRRLTALDNYERQCLLAPGDDSLNRRRFQAAEALRHDYQRILGQRITQRLDDEPRAGGGDAEEAAHREMRIRRQLNSALDSLREEGEDVYGAVIHAVIGQVAVGSKRLKSLRVGLDALRKAYRL